MFSPAKRRGSVKVGTSARVVLPNDSDFEIRVQVKYLLHITPCALVGTHHPIPFNVVFNVFRGYFRWMEVIVWVVALVGIESSGCNLSGFTNTPPMRPNGGRTPR